MNQTMLKAGIASAIAVVATLLIARASLAADDTYQVTTIDASATVGTKAKANVTISAKKGWHLNAEAPLTLKLTPTPGVEVDKPKLGRGDLALSTESTARFEVLLTASEPGKKAIAAEASFVLCQEESCRPIREKLTFAIDATEAKTSPVKKPAKKK
jgi:hypothetical protein